MTTTQDDTYPKRWLAAVVMMLAALMDLIDGTIVNVALPTIQRDLGAGGTDLEWVVSAYMLAFASTLIVAGRLGDLFGRKRLFLGGVAAFGVASLICGVAQTPAELIAARAAQGVAAATLMPQVLATFRTVFSGKERGAVFGAFGALGGIAVAFGVSLGGLLVDANVFGLGWRAVFLVNVPVAACCLVAGGLFVPTTRERSPGRPDLLGGAVLAAGLVAIVLPLLEGRRLGWPLWGWICLGVGIVAVIALGALEARRREVTPLLPAPLFRVPAFSAGLLVQLLFSAGLQGFSLTFALWLQSGQRYSPTHAGLTLLAFCAGSFLTAGPAAQLAQRFGRVVLMAGGMMLTVGVAGIDYTAHHVSGQVGTWDLVPGLVVAGAGLGLLVVPLVNVVLAAVPRDAAGSASGIFTTSQQLGGALGVAILGTLFFGHVDGPDLTSAFTYSLPFVGAAFLACAALSVVLPKTAVEELLA